MIFGHGYKGEYLLIRAVTIFVLWAIPLHCYMLFVLYEQSFKLSVLTGFFSGTVLTLAARMGLALSYLLLASDRKLGTLINIFGDSWQIYLWMGLLGIVCMLVDPFFRIVLHKDLFRNPKPSLFWTKYSPSALFFKLVLHKDLYERNNKDVDGKNGE
jgi:hypothetical protein